MIKLRAEVPLSLGALLEAHGQRLAEQGRQAGALLDGPTLGDEAPDAAAWPAPN